MSLPESSLNILLINENPDEIKLVTTSLRSFFTGCRIEAGYSSEEALAFSQQGDWHIILIDQDLSPERGLDLIARLRRNAPYAAILLQTNESDSHTAIQALQHGADFLLFKRSPGFITELLFSVQEALEKRDLQMKLDHTFQRHLRFIETLSDLLYELDAEGRFVYVSTTVTAMLGYTSEELAGRHYSVLLPPLQEQTGRFRLNERRAGSRSIRRLELTLHRKPQPDAPPVPITVEVTAKGLFDSANRYLGTVGLLRDLSQQKAQLDRLAELESRLQETDRQLTLSREAARVSRQLQQPLTTLLQDSQRLLTSIQGSRIEQHVETMIAKASQASQLGHQLAQAIHTHQIDFVPVALNEILQTVAQTVRHETEGSRLVLTTHFAMDLPIILGSRAALEDVAQILLHYARVYTSDITTPSRLILQTETITLDNRERIPQSAGSHSEPLQTYASFSIRETALGRRPPTNPPLGEEISADRFFQAHQIIQAHRGAIAVEHTSDSGFSITVRIPAAEDFPFTSQPSDSPSAPTPLPQSGIRTHARYVSQQRPERRRSERKPFSLPVQLSIGGATLRGLLRNMSAEGALLTIRGMSTSIHLQPAYVVIKTPVSFLELQGVVHERPSSAVEVQLPAIKDFVISFVLTVKRDRDVLRSLLDGLHDGSTQVTFEGLILPPFPTTESQPLDLVVSTPRQEDRREAVRLRFSCPVEVVDLRVSPSRTPGHIVNLSLEGACLEVPTHFRLPEPREAFQLIPVGASKSSSNVPDMPWSEQPWTARIIWKHPARPQTLSSPAATEEQRRYVGVRFERLSIAQEQRLRSFIDPGLRGTGELADPMSDAPVQTASHLLRNREGETIALRHDFPKQALTEQCPLVILCPGYGTTQQSYVAFAYALAGCGLQVLRYDHSRHIGLSDGDPSQTTFTSLEDDLDTVLAFTRKNWPETPLTLLAPDILGRIALRRQDWHRQLRRLILLNPMLDIGHCLTTLHQRDLLQEHVKGFRPGLGNLLGLPLDIDHFLADAITAQYTNVATLQEELTHCGTDMVFLAAGQDSPDFAMPAPPPLLLDDVIRRLGSRSRKVLIPSSLVTAGQTAPSILRANWQQISQLCHSGNSLQEPGTRALPGLARATSTRARFERDQLRSKYALGTAGNERLWAAQTELTRTLDELPAHWHCIDQLYQLLQPLDGNLALLDVGCGMHSFARLLLLNLSYRLRAQTWHHNKPLRYVGVDFSSSALETAQTAMNDALQHVDKLFSGRISGPTPLTQQWVLGRSVETLPFADNSFDRVVANLSLSFARSPHHALRELFRVLRPGGRLVLSAFTPAADAARLYRPALQELGIDAFAGEPRSALNRMAQCCVALRIGQLHAFEEERLNTLFSQLTPTPARLVHTLSGQILLAAAEKPDSSS